jgi:hypothetical protein
MNIEIIDEDELGKKGYASSYLFKVLIVDSVKLSKPIIIEFKDETEEFPEDIFQLYK